MLTGTDLRNAVLEDAFAFNTKFNAVLIDGADFTNVPLRVSICDWAMTDTKDFRMRNMAYHSDGCVAEHQQAIWTGRIESGGVR